jgi:hypothetical protein
MVCPALSVLRRHLACSSMSMAFWLAAPEPEIARTAMFGAKGPLRGLAPVSTRCTDSDDTWRLRIPSAQTKTEKSGAVLRDEMALLHAACRQRAGREDTLRLALKNAAATRGIVTRSSRSAGEDCCFGA